ncbi:hypothetical protein UlMin_015032 [Ulmus minor]
MADDREINGIDDQASDNFFDADQTAELNRKLEVLQQEKLKSIGESQAAKERIEKLTIEIERLKSLEEESKEKLRELEKEIEQSEENKRAAKAIAARAVELETDVSRLQHDLISAMTAAEEANSEVGELKIALAERGSRIETLEGEVDSLKTAKAESEKRVRELERKVGVLEVREIEEKSKKVRAEEESRERIEEKEREINGFRKKVEELESTIAKSGAELDKCVKEKLSIEGLRKESEERAKAMESKVHQLQKELEEAEKFIKGVKDKTVEAINGTANEVKEIMGGGENVSLQWPVVAGSTGAVVAAAALLYVLYERRQ